jgi:CheY-like chemotaxis protein
MTLKVFVADDSVTIQKTVGLAFGSEDAIIQSVSHGDFALDEIRAFKPDIVLADVFMPGCNGYEVCAHIKKDPELNNTPVILLVGTFEPFDESEAYRVKCDGFLTKPFDATELIQMAQKLVITDAASQQPEESLNAPATVQAGKNERISSNARTSFLGSGRVLELFDPEIFSAGKRTGRRIQPQTFSEPPASKTPALTDERLSEEVIDLIVDRVVRRMSADVVREVAWEVVPELSEVIIRRTIEERKKTQNQ